MEEIKEQILNVDWEEFDGPELYKSKSVAEALIALVDLDEPERANEVGQKVTNAIGNDHAGAYYPVILKALDFIIFLAQNSNENRAREICSGAILNDLYYFEPEMGTYRGCTSDELKKFAIVKLQPFSV